MGFKVKNKPVVGVKMGRPQKYAWDDLHEVGDCFLVPNGIMITSLRNLAVQAGMARGKRFAVSQENDNMLVQYVSDREAK